MSDAIKMPSNAAEWAQVLAGADIPTPTYTWRTMEASGSLTTNIGGISYLQLSDYELDDAVGEYVLKREHRAAAFRARARKA